MWCDVNLVRHGVWLWSNECMWTRELTLVPRKIKFSVKVQLGAVVMPPDIDGSVQERRNSIANALELRLSCTKPSIWCLQYHKQKCGDDCRKWTKCGTDKITSCLAIMVKIWIVCRKEFTENWPSALILGLCQANERWRYFVTTSLIGWEPCISLGQCDYSIVPCGIWIKMIIPSSHPTPPPPHPPTCHPPPPPPPPHPTSHPNPQRSGFREKSA